MQQERVTPTKSTRFHSWGLHLRATVCCYTEAKLQISQQLEVTQKNEKQKEKKKHF